MTRLNYIDCVKGFCILLVVLGHIVPHTNPICVWIYSFHLPLFFMISGYLLAYKDSWKNRGIKENIKKLACNLLYPYFTFGICSIIILIAKDTILNKINIIRYIKDIIELVGLWGYYTLWFLPALFIGEALFFIINKKQNRNRYIYIILMIMTIVGCYVLKVYDNLEIIKRVIFKVLIILNRAFIGTIFINIGYMLYNYVKRFKLENKSIIIGSILIIIFNFFISQHIGFSEIYNMNIKNPIIYYYYSISTSIAILLIFKYFNIKNKFIEFLGRNSLIIMATHAPFLIIYFLEYIINTDVPLINYLSIFIILVIIECILILVINKYLTFMIKMPEMYIGRLKNNNFLNWRNIMKIKIKKFLTIVSPELETKLAFQYSFGKKLDLKNPKDINEKILWLKLNTYNNNEIVTNCIDKYRMREYLKLKGLEELAPKLYGVYDTVEEIEWEKLPSSYVVKCNHGCGYNILVPDSKKLDINEAIIKLKRWIKEDYWKNGGEIQYKYINKKIIIEEYLGDIKNYKFYCFNGIPKAMYVSTNEWIGNNCEKDKYIDFFDMEFKHINCKLKGHDNYNGVIEKPVNFEEMKKVSKVLSEDFPFVRVDLYDVNGKVYISELTFIPTAGFMHLNPSNIVEEWGSWLKL